VGRPSKLSDDDRREALQLHAAGESCRAIARRFDVSPTVISRLTRAANDTPGAAPKNVPSAGRTHSETEFPVGVGSFAPEKESVVLDMPAVISTPELPPERAPGQPKRSNEHPLAWAEHRLKCARQDVEHIHTAPEGYAAERDKKLAQAVARERELAEFIDHWAEAYASIPFGRPRTMIPVSSQTLTDGAPRALWDNPHEQGPRGFTVVGS
jgi:transposase-like protein